MKELLKELYDSLGWVHSIIAILAFVGFIIFWILAIVFWFNNPDYTQMMMFKKFWIWWVILVPTLCYLLYKLS